MSDLLKILFEWFPDPLFRLSDRLIVQQNPAAQTAFPWLSLPCAVQELLPAEPYRDLFLSLVDPGYWDCPQVTVADTHFAAHAHQENGQCLLALRPVEMTEPLEMMNNIGQYMRQPLQMMTASLQTMGRRINENKVGKKALRQSFAEINRNVYRLMRLSNNLVDVAQASKRQFHLDVRECDLVHLGKELGKKVNAHEQDTGVHVTFEANVPHLLCAVDAALLERILLNLLSNALHWSPENGQVVLSLQASGQVVTFTVRDEGTGIDPESYQNLYDGYRVPERMFRAPERVPQPGLGLGLPLVKELAALLDGHIQVETGSAGTAVCLSLPLRMLPSSHEILKSPIFTDYAGEFRHDLVELADILPSSCEAYKPKRK